MHKLTIKEEKTFIQVMAFLLCIIIGAVLYLNPEPDYTRFHSDYPVGSDGYLEDSLAYAHPSWSYEKIQEEIYGKPVE